VAVRRHACFGYKNVVRESSPEEDGRRKAAICKARGRTGVPFPSITSLAVLGILACRTHFDDDPSAGNGTA
jgi:hypothetical protein